ncbi:4479_t:CDS:1, partial [Ambispora leptoticha]
KNQPTFLQPGNVNTYNVEDDGVFEESSELDGIFHWDFVNGALSLSFMDHI